MPGITEYYNSKFGGSNAASSSGSITSYYAGVKQKELLQKAQATESANRTQPTAPPISIGQLAGDVQSGGLTMLTGNNAIQPGQKKLSTNQLQQVKTPAIPEVPGQTYLKAAPAPTVWDKITGWVSNLFDSETSQKARAMNAYAVQNSPAGQKLLNNRIQQVADQYKTSFEQARQLVENQAKAQNKSTYDIVGLSLDKLAEKGGNPIKNSVFEDVTKELGIRDTPTPSELGQKAMTAAVGLGLVTAPVPTLVGLGIFSAVNEFKSGLISAVKGEGFKLGANKTFGDLFENAPADVRTLLDVADFMVTAKTTHAIYTTAPKAFDLMTKDVIERYNLPKTVNIPARTVKEVVIGNNTGAERDLLSSLGLSSDQWKAAVKQGITVEVPAEKITSVVDKPYWSKLKEIIGREPTNIVNRETAGKTQMRPGIAGELPAGQPGQQPVGGEVVFQPEKLGGVLDRLSTLSGDTQAARSAPATFAPVADTPRGQQIYENQSTQLNLPSEVGQKVTDFASRIPDEELSIDKNDHRPGREPQPHITVLYGLDSKVNAGDIQKVIGNVSPIEVTLGETSVFKNDKYDVLKIDVNSPALHELNKKIADHLPTPGQTHPDYSPHVTIAYMQKGTADKYVGDKTFAGDKITLNELTFSRNDGKQIAIPLTQQAPPNAFDKTPGAELTPSQKPVGDGKVRESKAYERVRSQLEEATRQDVNYNRLNLAQDAENAVNFIASQPDAALRVAFGLEAPPAGQTETAISIALADKAGREGKFELQSQLEASRSLRQTRRGQEIVSERGRFNDDSPHRYMADLLDQRLTNLGRSIKSEVADTLPKPEGGKQASAKKRAVDKIDAETKKLQKILQKRDAKKIKLAQDIIDSLICK